MPGGRRGARGGSVAVFLVACLVVLALTFLLGVLVGRQWARGAADDSARLAGTPERPGARPRARRLSERDPEEPVSQLQGKLTFYQTLTAPLTPGPLPGPTRSTEHAPAASGVRYTIQVAAFKSRVQANRLRERLGGEAYVDEVASGPGAPFRVRVGSFASRAEAEARAVRLRADHAPSSFVTPQ